MLAGLALFALIPSAITPTPKSFRYAGGTFTLRDSARIVAPYRYQPQARILQADIRRLTGLRLPIHSSDVKPGDIELNHRGAKDQYRLSISDQVTIRAGSPQAMSWAVTSLIQTLQGREFPRLQVQDQPDYPYRGAMLDLARKPHTIEGIRQIVDLCRLYKLNYLHLHLSDDHLFMFPSKAFPTLGKGNHEFARFDPPSTDAPIKPYTREELRELDDYAADRGVTLIPEIDMPGHGSRLTQDAPEFFRATEKNPSTINFASKKTIDACKTLLGEVMDIFRHTPYIHLGGDEVWTGELADLPDFKDADPHGLFRRFISEMVGFVREKGRRAIVWEEAYSNGSGNAWPLPKDAVVMAWSVAAPIQRILSEGYSVINAGWTPMYIVRDDKRSPRFIEGWKVTNFGSHPASFTNWILADGPGLLGAQMCSWENAESIELQSLRLRLPIVAERTWNRESAGRVANADALVERLLCEVSIQSSGPLVRDENSFEDPVLVEMKSASGGTIRYRLDNRLPTLDSPIYRDPITLEESAWIRAAAFDAKGRQIGPAAGAWFNRRPKFIENAATGKPVTVTNPEADIDPKVAVDGNIDRDRHWAGRTPSSLTVDLQAELLVDKVTLMTYYDGGRYYQYTIEGSRDGITWFMLDDASKNTAVAAASGYTTMLKEPQRCAYIRVNMLKNSANPGTHIVELMVFGKR